MKPRNDLRWAVVSLWVLILVPAWAASCLDPRPIPNTALATPAAFGGGGGAYRSQIGGRLSSDVSAESGAAGAATREQLPAGRFLEQHACRPRDARFAAWAASGASRRPAGPPARPGQRPVSPFGWLILDATLLASGAMLGEAARLSGWRLTTGRGGAPLPPVRQPR